MADLGEYRMGMAYLEEHRVDIAGLGRAQDGHSRYYREHRMDLADLRGAQDGHGRSSGNTL